MSIACTQTVGCRGVRYISRDARAELSRTCVASRSLPWRQVYELVD